MRQIRHESFSGSALSQQLCVVLKDLHMLTEKGPTPNFKVASLPQQCRFSFCSFKLNQDFLLWNFTVKRRAVSVPCRKAAQKLYWATLQCLISADCRSNRAVLSPFCPCYDFCSLFCFGASTSNLSFHTWSRQSPPYQSSLNVHRN